MINLVLSLQLFVYLHLIIGILSLCISAHLTVLLLLNPVLNLTFSLLPITSSHSYAMPQIWPLTIGAIWLLTLSRVLRSVQTTVTIPTDKCLCVCVDCQIPPLLLITQKSCLQQRDRKFICTTWHAIHLWKLVVLYSMFLLSFLLWQLVSYICVSCFTTRCCAEYKYKLLNVSVCLSVTMVCAVFLWHHGFVVFIWFYFPYRVCLLCSAIYMFIMVPCGLVAVIE